MQKAVSDVLMDVPNPSLGNFTGLSRSALMLGLISYLHRVGKLFMFILFLKKKLLHKYNMEM